MEVISGRIKDISFYIFFLIFPILSCGQVLVLGKREFIYNYRLGIIMYTYI